MSENGKYENLLIDFENVNMSDGSSNVDQTKQTHAVKSTELDSLTTKQTSKSMAFLCSSQPLYKLLQRSESIDDGDNNPFDHLDKQAGLLDDPFEIVENAALVSSDSIAEIGTPEVETGTLISIDSPISLKIVLESNCPSKASCDTPKPSMQSNDNMDTQLINTQSNESVQSTSQKQLSSSKGVSQNTSASPSGNTRNKTKNTSLNLLKYSLSNSRLDLACEENLCGDDALYKKQKPGVRRDSGTDDSFDDIWATKPNLIDSQTDIDIDSDIDNDIAKLNIPMLNISMPSSKFDESAASNGDDQDDKELLETRAANRKGFLEKLASIKQKIPQSPKTNDINDTTKATTTTTIPIHNQTVDIKCSELHENTDDEPVTPKSQYSSVMLRQQLPSDNPNSLIENLKKMVDQCDDKSQQITANHLLDDLSSILNKGGEKQCNERHTNHNEMRQPQLIKRQGTFSIERDSCNTDLRQVSEKNCSEKSVKCDTKENVMNHDFSEMMKQIQNAFGTHQNINVLQTNGQDKGLSTASAVNPTYIVVMTQPMVDFNEDTAEQRPHRNRSQSLTLKEKPLSALRAIQHKMEQSQTQTQPSLAVTPIKRPVLQRRSSFGTITRPKAITETEHFTKPSNPVIKPDAQKLIRRRSIQGPAIKHEESETIQPKPINPIIRRRSFQGTVTASGIRPPSPKANLNLGRDLNTNTTGTLTRRKSLAADLTKDSPQKMKSSSYGIMKKPPVPPTARNLKIRVSQAANGRSTAPLRAVVPMKSLLLINETVSPVDDKKTNALVTSTPRSIPSPAKFKKGPLTGSSTLPVESPIQNLDKDSTYLPMTPSKTSIQSANNKVVQRRRTLSDYRTEVNNSITVDMNSGGRTVSSIKSATKTLATGLSKFTAKKMSSIGLKRPSSAGSKENKQPQ